VRVFQDASPVWGRCRRAALFAVLTLTAISGSYAAYCGALRYTGNFHVVEKGLFYRSAQLDKAGFERTIRDHTIRSVLNLRGAAKGAWYRDELQVSKALGVEHYDYYLSAHRMVDAQQINQILKIIRAAPKPILVHCNAGSDRAGLISALYLLDVEGDSPNDAAKQLSLLYGHFPYLTSETDAMDQSFWSYVKSSSRPSNRR
jgi:protein tyrosine/serine phosphatase